MTVVPLEQRHPEFAQLLMDIVNKKLPARVEGDKVFDTRFRNREVLAASPFSRNDPCPCGSGQKVKKCCGSGR